MNNIIKIFKEITSIQRASLQYKDFISYMKEFAQTYDYIILIDSYNNILCKKENSQSKLCIQNHYDIVCLDDGSIPIIIEDEEFLKAKNSTLGADNGIGCSYMLDLMTKNYDLEFLFTSDEEIGLIGAKNIELKLNSTYMLNIDSEAEGEVCVGCAGGIDIFARNTSKSIIENKENLNLYEISISNLQGGHSGLDINKNIPNAIKLIIQTIKQANALLLDINGGERINSIPVNVKAIIACKSKPEAIHKNICIKQIANKGEHFSIWHSDIIDYIYTFLNGVLSYDDKLDAVHSSINLAKISTSKDCISLELSARSMNNDELNNIKNDTINGLEKYNFTTSSSGKYPAWEANINEFSKKVLDIYKKYDNNASFKTMHAGLECAIFQDKFPNMKIASIGPNIYFPHSRREKVEIQSINNLYLIINDIVNSL